MYQKFKDKLPEETIQIARQILLGWRVTITEKWYDDLENLYSVTLNVVGTDFCTHGKGTNKLFALASAYGEMMERMQNLSFFRLIGTTALDDSNQYQDDTYVDNNLNEDLFFQRLAFWVTKVNKHTDNDIINKMKEYCTLFENHIRYYCFHNIKNDDQIFLPQGILDLFYGTNGMVAGNSDYEALVQGISEILERYVINIIMSGKITPPDITTYIIEVMPEARKWINSIEYGNKFIVEIKDLSLNQGIPAIGLILYNKEEATYFVKVAVHPISCNDNCLQCKLSSCCMSKVEKEIYKNIRKTSKKINSKGNVIN